VKAEVDASENGIQMVVSDMRAASAAGVSFGSACDVPIDGEMYTTAG
jgi:hypothetical protein